MSTVSTYRFVRQVARATGISMGDAKLIVQAMILVTKQAIQRGEAVQLTGFGTFEPRTRNGTTTIGFRPSQVLKDLIRGSEPWVGSIHPDEVEDSSTYVEGATQQIMVNRYERDGRARYACVAHYGTTCRACGLDFGERYGQLGQGFIHVHHTRPLAGIRQEYSPDPVRDLIPVCPNCHGMLHRREPPLSVEELRAMLREHEGKA
jgi:predicted HNH restriction endonuclease